MHHASGKPSRTCSLKRKNLPSWSWRVPRWSLLLHLLCPRCLQTLYQAVEIVPDLQELEIKQLATEAAQPDSGRTTVRLISAGCFALLCNRWLISKDKVLYFLSSFLWVVKRMGVLAAQYSPSAVLDDIHSSRSNEKRSQAQTQTQKNGTQISAFSLTSGSVYKN